ncbi:MAG: hypothetical protein IJN42_02090 [Clostridia bacterium]|nr:hypothetical protein [Clostridia bacterium]MBQ6946811.1 hypothetical protein [Clostridia bacterium]
MKKMISLLLVAALTVCLFALPASAEINSVGGFGDLDGDGVISASDALEVLRHVVGKSTIEQQHLCFGDVNTDYQVTASDALDILKRVVGKIKGFAADDDYYVSITSVNAVEARRGAAASLRLEVESEGTGDTLYANFDSNALNVGSDGGTGIINLTITPTASASVGTVYPMVFYVGNHPSLYKIVNIVVVG